MKRTVLLTLCVLCCVAAQGQRFEWAKGYSSSLDGCSFRGTVTDSEGNLYLLGHFTPDATWDGERLLPFAITDCTIGTVIAKISPDGDLLWKKLIHTGNYANDIAYDIKKVGDTAIACLVNVELPTFNYHCYYLDTLLLGWSDYPVQLDPFTNCSPTVTAYLLFDYGGRLLEEHFLQVSYIDNSGADYLDGWRQELTNTSFDLDDEGNIYFSRQAEDYADGATSVEAGTLKGVRFWVDQRLVGTILVDDGHHPRWSPQLLKFAPHFDTLLAARYLLQRNDNDTCYITSTYTKVDHRGRVYSLSTLNIGGIVRNVSDTLVVDSLQGLSFVSLPAVSEKGVLVRFDEDLTPDWVVTLDDSVVNSSINLSRSWFHDVEFDYDSNLIFLSLTSLRGATFDTVNFYSIPLYRGIPLPLRNNTAVLIFEEGEGRPTLRSCAVVPSLAQSDACSNSIGNLACRAGRVFIQSRFYGGLHEYVSNSIYDVGLGLTVFDYNGKVMGGVPYRNSSPQSRPGPIAIQDSILYLGTLFYGDNATFGERQIYGERTFSCIAKCIVKQDDYLSLGEWRVESGEWRVMPNPTTGECSVVSVQCSVESVTDLYGRRIEVPIVSCGEGRYSVDLSSCPAGIYLVSLTSASGVRNTARVVKIEN